MDFFFDGLKYSALAYVFWSGWRLFVARYRRATFLDSEAPGGLRTDWDLFWGRKGR